MIKKTTLKRSWHGKKAFSLTTLFLCLFLIKSEAQQQVVFSEEFSNPDNDVSECTAWNTFSAELDADKNYLSVLIKGSENETGLLLDNPERATELAAAIHDSQEISFTADGQFWTTYLYQGSVWVSASSIGTSHSAGSCINGAEYFTVRACLENGNFGGISGLTCNAPTQRIDLIFTYGGIELVENTPATCPESSDGALSVGMNGGVAPYTFEWSNGETSTSGQAIDDYTLLGHYDDHSFYRSDSKAASFDEAQTFAESQFGYLASINSIEENTWLMANGVMNGDKLGGADANQEGTWEWSSGQPFNFTNWAVNEPNNSGGDQDYMQIYANGTWDDAGWGVEDGARQIIEVTAVSEINNLTPGEYTLTVTDAEGAEYTSTFVVGPVPMEITFDMTQTSTCDENGDGALVANVTGGNAPYTYVWSSGETTADISNKGFGEYTVTVTDANSCATVEGSDTITPDDSTLPTVMANDLTIYLDENGDAQVSVEDVDNGSFDDCNLELALSQTDFDCSHLEPAPASFDGETVLSFDGTDDNLTFNSALAQSPNHTIAAWIKTTSSSRSVFGWGGAGVNNYSGMAFQGANIRYYAGNGTPPMESVTGSTPVIDGNWHHVALTRSNAGEVKIYVDGNLDASGSVTKYVSNVTTSSLGAILANGIFQMNFLGDMDEFSYWSEVLTDEEISAMVCNGPVSPLVHMNFEDGAGNSQAADLSGNANHATLVNMDINNSWNAFGEPALTPGCVSQITTTLVGTDPAGNSASAVSVLTVLDTISPVAMASTHTIYLDENGAAVLNPADIDNGSTDNCSIESITASMTAFDCSNLGLNNVVMTVTDNSGNTNSTTTQVEVLDNISPIVVAENINVFLDENGTASIVFSDVENSSSDNCGIASKSIDVNQFSCEDLGSNEVVLTVVDNSGNETQESAMVTVIDLIEPVAVAQAFEIELDANGFAELTSEEVAESIGSGSFDNCGLSSNSHELNQMTFTCADLGTNTFTYSVQDNSGNLAHAPVEITVIDVIDPVVVAQNITVELDENGYAIIEAIEADGGSSDNCSIASMSLNVFEFTCDNIGENAAMLTVTDASGNQSNQNFEILVVDNIGANIPEFMSVTVYVDANGEGVLDTAPLLAEANDNCGLDAIVVEGKGEYFDINGFPFTCEEVGNSSGPAYVRDSNGNLTEFGLELNVVDTIKPTLNLETMSLYLDAAGAATLTEDMISDYALDNCGISEINIGTSDFNCSLGLDAQAVEISMLDLHGNSNLQMLDIQLVDTISPEVQVENITIQLDQNGQATLSPESLEMIASDNCQTADVSISQTLFSCEDIGNVSLSVTVLDASGNIGVAEFEATIEDNESPEISAPLSIQVCEGIPVSYDEVVAADNCSVELSVIGGPQAGEMLKNGEYMVEFEAVDPSGNAITKFVILDVIANPDVNLGDDMEVESGTLVTLEAGENDDNEYVWNVENTGSVYEFIASEDVLVSVEVISPEGCSANDEIEISISNSVGIEDNSAQSNIRFYPNPTKGALSVALSLAQIAMDVQITVTDLAGKVVAQKSMQTAKDGDVISLDLSGFADGVYLVNVQSDSFNITKRAVKH